jgi:hypothetical protein
MATNSLDQAVALGAVFEQELGVPFSSWIHDDGNWRHSPLSRNEDQWTQSHLEQFIRAALDNETPLQEARVVTLDDKRQLVLVPADSERAAAAVAVGIMEPCDAKLLQAMSNSLRRFALLQQKLDAQQKRLEECYQQITADFEELTWLRMLTAHFELCDVRNDLAGVAQRTLPSLRQLIDADSLVLFGANAIDEDCPTDIAPGKLLFSDGVCPASEGELRQFIDQRRHKLRGNTFVFNCAEPDDLGIQNCIIVRLNSGQTHVGWLCAFNKRGAASRTANADPGCRAEFGTFEAGLMSAAAVMYSTHGRNIELFQEKESLLVGVIRALINAIDAKDKYTFGHSDRVASISLCLGRQLGLSEGECEQIYMTGLLHDIGKIGVPDRVLGKPDKLTDEEFALIKLHPEIGVEILKDLRPLNYVLPGVLHHHESVDGSGYPHALAGDDIPLHGRILAVADAYDAMTSDRPYRKGMPPERAEGILRANAGKQWDARIVDAFFTAVDKIHDICGFVAPETVRSPVVVGESIATRLEVIGSGRRTSECCTGATS